MPAPVTGQTSDREHTHMLTVFSVSSAMVGVCLTAVGLIQVMQGLKNINTLCDEILVFNAILFLCATILSYWALHHRLQRRYKLLRLAVDTALMLGIVMMVVICAMIAYTITERPRAGLVPGPGQTSATPVGTRSCGESCRVCTWVTAATPTTSHSCGARGSRTS